MFTQSLPPGVFETQREFIRVMGGKLDFVWAARTLVVEETKELKEEFDAEVADMENIFKELADVIYVVAYFYNVMPNFAPEVIDEQTNEEIQRIMDEAAVVVSEVSQKFKIPLPLIVAAFEEVHRSNMSKLDDDGKPIRREDGKILKGPNYAPPSMQKVVDEWAKVTQKMNAKETLGNA